MRSYLYLKRQKTKYHSGFVIFFFFLQGGRGPGTLWGEYIKFHWMVLGYNSVVEHTNQTQLAQQYAHTEIFISSIMFVFVILCVRGGLNLIFCMYRFTSTFGNKNFFICVYKQHFNNFSQRKIGNLLQSRQQKYKKTKTDPQRQKERPKKNFVLVFFL